MRKLVAGVVGWALLAVYVLVAWSDSATGAVKFADADFHGYSTGTLIHADVGQGPVDGTPVPAAQLLHAEVGFTGATVASKGTGAVAEGPFANPAAGKVVNEMNQVVQPTLPITGDAKAAGDRSFGRSGPVEIGIANGTPVEDPDIILPSLLTGEDQIRASAPPNSSDVDELLNANLGSLAHATLLRGEADAKWTSDACPTAVPLSQGRAVTADVQLLNGGVPALGAEPGPLKPDGSFEKPFIATDSNNPERTAGHARSTTQLVPTAPGSSIMGLQTETRMTFAPVTLNEGDPTGQTTIEILGEWVLRTVATGSASGATVYYGPADRNPETPILRIIQPNQIVRIVSFQEIFDNPLLGPGGLIITIPSVGTIAIGEPPRAITRNGDENDQIGLSPLPGQTLPKPPVQTATKVEAAVDVVRVKLLPGNPYHLADVRIGHMESTANVPAGGIDCSAGPPDTTPSTGGSTSTSTSTTTPSSTTTTTTASSTTSTTTASSTTSTTGATSTTSTTAASSTTSTTGASTSTTSTTAAPTSTSSTSTSSTSTTAAPDPNAADRQGSSTTTTRSSPPPTVGPAVLGAVTERPASQPAAAQTQQPSFTG